MTDHKPADVYEFETGIIQEGSWGSRQIAQKAKCVMSLYFNKNGSGFIEWELPDLGMYEEIGLTFEYDDAGKRTLTDYDGVMSIPEQALDLLERNKVNVSEMRKSME